MRFENQSKFVKEFMSTHKTKIIYAYSKNDDLKSRKVMSLCKAANRVLLNKHNTGKADIIAARQLADDAFGIDPLSKQALIALAKISYMLGKVADGDKHLEVALGKLSHDSNRGKRIAVMTSYKSHNTIMLGWSMSTGCGATHEDDWNLNLGTYIAIKRSINLDLMTEYLDLSEAFYNSDELIKRPRRSWDANEVKKWHNDHYYLIPNRLIEPMRGLIDRSIKYFKLDVPIIKSECVEQGQSASEMGGLIPEELAGWRADNLS